MRLLMVGNFFGVAVGCRQYCFHLASRLTAQGHQVLKVSPFRNRPLRLLDMASAPWRLRAKYDVAQVDVFSGPSFLWAEAAAAALRAAGKPFVLTLHGGALPQFARRHPWRVRRLLRSAAAVTAPSAYLAGALKTYRPDIRVIPNALDLSRYPFRHRKAAKPRLIWLRAFHRIYAPETAIQTLTLLVKEFPEVQLTMVGPDKDGSLARCRALAEELGVANHVAFVPGIPPKKVPEALSSADVFLNTTTVDNTPVSVIEAMACGLCIVSTDVGGVPHLVRDGEEALLVPAGDAAATAGALRRLMEEPALAERLSGNARKKAEGFDWSAVFPAWEAVLQGLRIPSEGHDSQGTAPQGFPSGPGP